MVAKSTIGGFNPCGFHTRVQLTDPDQGTVSAAYPSDPEYGYLPSLAEATVTTSSHWLFGTYAASSEYGIEDDTALPWQYYTPNGLSQQIQVKPLIDGLTDVWWFGSQSPPGYTTQLILTSDGGPSTTWSIVQGASKVEFANIDWTQAILTSTGSQFSASLGDVLISVTADGVTSDPFAITSRRPFFLSYEPALSVTNESSIWGYETFIAYTIKDQLWSNLPSAVPVNENWSTGVVTDYAGMDWRRGAPGGFTTGGDARFADDIQGESVGHTPPPTYGGTSVAVYHWGQEWRVGSTTPGQGILVTTVILQKYNNQAEHQPQ